MNSFLEFLPSGSWTVGYTVLGLTLFILLGKTILGWVLISPSKSGLVEKKWSLLGEMPNGRIIAIKGEAGIQADLLAPGLHFWKWWWMYSVTQIDPILILTGRIGIVNAENGASLESGAILAKTVVDSNDFQDAKAFLDGKGVIGARRKIALCAIFWAPAGVSMRSQQGSSADIAAETEISWFCNFDYCRKSEKSRTVDGSLP